MFLVFVGALVNIFERVSLKDHGLKIRETH